MKFEKQLQRALILSAAFSLTGCLKLDVTPVTIDANAMLGYAIPTNPKKAPYDIDLRDLKNIHKFTCFSADDMADIERALNH